jgi:hypothetical protein
MILGIFSKMYEHTPILLELDKNNAHLHENLQAFFCVSQIISQMFIRVKTFLNEREK